MTNGCQMEIGEVEKLADYRRLCEAGVGRIVTRNVWEIYCDWMKEADQIMESGAEKLPDTQTKDVKKEEMISSNATPKNTPNLEKKTENNSSLPIECEGLNSKEKQTETALAVVEKNNAPSANQPSLESEMRTGFSPSRMENSDLKIL